MMSPMRLWPILSLLLIPWLVAAETSPHNEDSAAVLARFANAYNTMDVAEMGELLDEPGLSKFVRDVQRWGKLGVRPELTLQPVQVESVRNELVAQCIVSLSVDGKAQLTNSRVLFYLSKRDGKIRISKYVVAEVTHQNEELEILHDLVVTLRQVANRRDWPAVDQLFRQGVAVQDRPSELEALMLANPSASWLGVLRNPGAKLEDITVQRDASGPIATVTVIDARGHMLVSGRMRLLADERDGHKRYWLKPIADDHGDVPAIPVNFWSLVEVSDDVLLLEVPVTPDEGQRWIVHKSVRGNARELRETPVLQANLRRPGHYFVPVMIEGDGCVVPDGDFILPRVDGSDSAPLEESIIKFRAATSEVTRVRLLTMYLGESLRGNAARDAALYIAARSERDEAAISQLRTLVLAPDVDPNARVALLHSIAETYSKETTRPLLLEALRLPALRRSAVQVLRQVDVGALKAELLTWLSEPELRSEAMRLGQTFVADHEFVQAVTSHAILDTPSNVSLQLPFLLADGNAKGLQIVRAGLSGSLELQTAILVHITRFRDPRVADEAKGIFAANRAASDRQGQICKLAALQYLCSIRDPQAGEWAREVLAEVKGNKVLQQLFQGAMSAAVGRPFESWESCESWVNSL